MRYIIAILLVILVALQYRLWIGKGSMAEVQSLKQEVEQMHTELERLRERNRALRAEVTDLQTGQSAIEERARSELGMIKQGEVFYQLVEPENAKQ